MTYFSIIIPVYNVEEYILETLTSIINQTCFDFEVIIIDDGSKDASNLIAQNVCEQDGRFKLIKQENGGLSSARNVGIENSTGKYIYFLDGDDALRIDALQTMKAVIQDVSCDVYLFAAEVFGDMSSPLAKTENYVRLISSQRETGIEYLHRYANQYFSASACCYVASRKAINKLRFIPNVYYEDNPFIFRLLSDSNISIYANNEKLFLRRIRPNSIMTQAVSLKHYESMAVVTKAVAEISFGDRTDTKMKPISEWALSRLVGDLCSVSSRLKPIAAIHTRVTNLKILFTCTKRVGFGFLTPKRVLLAVIPEIYRLRRT